MSGVMGSETDILRYYQAARRNGIEIVGPSMNLSETEFKVSENKIVFPLSVIKGLGVVKTEQLLQERI